MEASQEGDFVRSFLLGFFEGQLLNNEITVDEYYTQIDLLQKHPRLDQIAEELFRSSPKAIEVPGLGLSRIVSLREMDGKTFFFLQNVAGPINDDHQRRRCFVGHRFLESINQSLRFNLVNVLHPHHIDLHWAGQDLGAADIFGKVKAGIAESQMCIFDNLGTRDRPNVYIEIGIASALNIPMIVCEYKGPTDREGFGVPAPGAIPSDLHGLLRIQYESYEELFRKLYFGLPFFLRSNGLRPRAA